MRNNYCHHMFLTAVPESSFSSSLTAVKILWASQPMQLSLNSPQIVEEPWSMLVSPGMHLLFVQALCGGSINICATEIFFSSNRSSSKYGHAGSLFTKEEQKKGCVLINRHLCHACGPLFMISQTQAADWQMQNGSALALFSGLSERDFLTN